jgi:hypothetical protein
MAMFRLLPLLCDPASRRAFHDIATDCDAKSGRRVALAAANRFFKLQACLVRSKWIPDQAEKLQNRTSVARIEGK